MDGLKSECLGGFRLEEVDGFVGIRNISGLTGFEATYEQPYEAAPLAAVGTTVTRT